MPDGSEWDVPAKDIARDYASQFEDSESQDRYGQIQMEAILRDDDALIDWAENNMNWEDVQEVAVQVKGPEDVEYQEGWVNGDKEVIEK